MRYVIYVLDWRLCYTLIALAESGHDTIPPMAICWGTKVYAGGLIILAIASKGQVSGAAFPQDLL